MNPPAAHAPAAPAPAPASGDDVQLLEMPDVAGTLRARWPRLALRAGMALALPVMVTLYAKALGFYGPVAQLGLPFDFLEPGPFAYEAKVIAFAVLCLLGGCYLTGEKAPRFVLMLCGGAILWAGFIYSRLQWTRLFLDAYDPLQVDAPSPAAWVYAFLLLGLGMAYLFAESLLDTRDAQARRGLPDDATGTLAKVSVQVALHALGLGLAAASLVALAFWAFRPLLTGLPFHVNPVLVLFGMGALLAVALALVARRQAVEAPGAPPRPAAQAAGSSSAEGARGADEPSSASSSGR